MFPIPQNKSHKKKIQDLSLVTLSFWKNKQIKLIVPFHQFSPLLTTRWLPWYHHQSDLSLLICHPVWWCNWLLSLLQILENHLSDSGLCHSLFCKFLWVPATMNMIIWNKEKANITCWVHLSLGSRQAWLGRERERLLGYWFTRFFYTWDITVPIQYT